MTFARPAAAFTLCLMLGGTVRAADLTPEQVAKIRLSEKAELKKVADAHGNKKPGEMDNDERREVIEQQAAASQSVLDKEGVSAKDYANYTARMSLEERAREKAAEEKLEAEAKAAAEKKAAEEKAKASAEPEVQQGFDEEHPVEMEAKEGDGPQVEYGTQADAMTPAAEPASSGGRSKHHGKRGRK